MSKKIFVQIASYRDPQLVPTLRSLFDNADNPEMFNVGIVWQKDYNESLEEFEEHPQVKYLTFDYKDSHGLGWARSQNAQLFDGEELTLQIDSHHRFLKGWDTLMLEDYEQALSFSDNPILSTYLTPFRVGDRDEPNQYDETPCLMSQYKFSDDKLLMSMPWYIQDFKERDTVIKARTISGHFYLVNSKFIHEVPYDPDIYFGGYCEETTMSVRAWTSGYDFFSPYRQYIWHEYTREGRPKHWEDHGKESKTEKTSGERDSYARKKTRQIFGQEKNNIRLGKFGLGKERTLKDYEKFCGFDFANSLISDYTLEVNEPPNPKENIKKQKEISTEDEILENSTPNADEQPILKYIYVKWDIQHFKEHEGIGYKTITLGIVDDNDNNLVRIDFTKDEYPTIHDYTINDILVETDISKSKKIIMFGLREDDTWSPPYVKNIELL